MATTSDKNETADARERDERREEAARLIALMAVGDHPALGKLYDLLGAVIYSLASRMLSDGREAEEVTQDVFLSAWQKAASYDASRASPLTWLGSMTRNRCIDRLRKSGRRIPQAPPEQEDSAPDRNVAVAEDRLSDPFLMLSLAELGVQIQKCLGLLPEGQRDVVELAYFEGLTHEEIAERTARPSGTVKSRLRLALEKLRGCLGGAAT